jgi:hypothetical protein
MRAARRCCLYATAEVCTELIGCGDDDGFEGDEGFRAGTHGTHAGSVALRATGVISDAVYTAEREQILPQLWGVIHADS